MGDKKPDARTVAQQAAAESLAARLLPGRARISIALYDQEGGRSFRGLPAHAVTIDIIDRRQLARVWAGVIKAICVETGDG